MAGSGQGYDTSVTTYSPDGRIFQIDYAQKCVDKGPTVLAFVCKDGVIMGAQKMKLSKMLVHGTNKRSYAISKTAACVVPGMVPEGRNVLSQARHEAQSYKKNYGDSIPGYILADRMGFYFHRYTLYASLRPLGTSMLLANYSKEDGPTLFSIEPSGLVQKWRGRAMGKGRQLANTEIEKLDLTNMTCQEALFHVAKILHKVYDETRAFELEMSWICEKSNWEYEPVSKTVTDDAEKRAKDAIEAEEDED